MKANPLFLAFLAGLALLASACKPDSPLEAISGTIEVDEVRIAPRAGGRVTQLFAREGDVLTAGQPVVALEAPDLQAQRDLLAAQLAELVAGPRQEEIAAGRADWEALLAQLSLARVEARRTAELFAQKTMSETDNDRAIAAVQTLEKQSAAARSRLDLLLAGTRPERLAAARAQLAEVETQLRELTVCAQTNCVLEVLSVKVGDVVPANREVATLLLTDHLWVRVFVPEPWLGQVKLGAPATVQVDAFLGRDFHGTIEQIARAAEFTPRNVQTVEERVKQVFGVKVRLDNSSGDLRAGMAADVTFDGRK